jgi:hypothetical protein
MAKPKLRKTQRITLSLAAPKLSITLVAELIEIALYRPTAYDLTGGFSHYDGEIQERVDVTFHETNVAMVLDVWRLIRNSQRNEVDCGRMYLADGEDYCCKDLDNFNSRKEGTVERFPGFNFKLGKLRLRWVRK